jgi:hypothetical protein
VWSDYRGNLKPLAICLHVQIKHCHCTWALINEFIPSILPRITIHILCLHSTLCPVPSLAVIFFLHGLFCLPRRIYNLSLVGIFSSEFLYTQELAPALSQCIPTHLLVQICMFFCIYYQFPNRLTFEIQR